MSYHLCKNYKDFQKALAIHGNADYKCTLKQLREDWKDYPEWLPKSFPCVLEWYYVSEDETDEAFGIGWWHCVLTLDQIKERIAYAKQIMDWEKYF